MWCNEDSWSSSHKRICKVCYIFLNLTTVKSFDQSFFINKKVSCKVQKNDTLFHLCESFFVDHLTRIICQRYMDRDIITLAVDFIQRFAVFDGSWQIPRCIDGNKRVISVNFHVEVVCSIGYENTDCSKTNNTNLFVLDFSSGKCFFGFFHCLCDVRVFFVLFYPFISTD